MINYKVVYRFDLYLLYLPVYLKTIRMPCLKKSEKNSHLRILTVSLQKLCFHSSNESGLSYIFSASVNSENNDVGINLMLLLASAALNNAGSMILCALTVF